MNSIVRKTLILLALIAVGIFVYRIVTGPNMMKVDEEEESKETVTQDPAVEIIPGIISEVVYTNEGFSPLEHTGEVDTAIIFKNNSQAPLEIEFIDRPELNMYEILPGEEGGSLPLSQIEVYEFRNANNPEHTGSIEILDDN